MHRTYRVKLLLRFLDPFILQDVLQTMCDSVNLSTGQVMTNSLVTKLGSSNPIYPFIFLSEYQVVVCQTCQYAFLASETAIHLT
jgi:hypothetical protein